MPVAEISRKAGFSQATYFYWKSKMMSEPLPGPNWKTSEPLSMLLVPPHIWSCPLVPMRVSLPSPPIMCCLLQIEVRLSATDADPEAAT